ncbi:unnamed protein product [Polarella glacialis]|uniref:Integral membrane bound transporter domain-containing protein n=1 Tax=Polarella glacialis TaxID=89957 RepID=A0A813JSN2_POLGL|nr:unnamed protein product [Polarella glacialis]
MAWTFLGLPQRSLLGLASLPFLWLFPDSRFLAPLLPPILTVECVRNAGGLGLVRQTAPLGFAVALCVAAKSVTSSLPPPWDGFQPSSAIVTILLLMETGITLERLLIKATQRIAGTCIGGMLAVASALILDQASHDRAVVASLFFAVFTSCAALQKNHSPVSYLFTVVSLTYSLVFYGFVNNGWPFLAGRLVSVFVGEVLSVLSSLGFDLVCRDTRASMSVCHILDTSKQIIDKTFLTLDVVFMRNQIQAAKESAQPLRVLGRRRTVSAAMGDFIGFGVETNVAKLKQLMHSDQLESYLALLESTEAALQTRCRACWSDMQTMGPIIHTLGVRGLLVEPPDYSVLPQRVHRIFVQSCAMAHSAPVEPECWRSAEVQLERVRAALNSVKGPLEIIFDHFPTFRSVSSVEKVELLRALQELSSALLQAQQALGLVWEVWKDWSDLIQPGQATRKGSLRRPAAFCHGFDLILVELAGLIHFYIPLFEIPEKECQEVVKTLADIEHSPASMLAGAH